MVSFIADPRIKRADKQRQLMLARALQPYKLPEKNPYGGSPVWGNLQRLAEGWAAGQAGKRATSLEKAQKDAQAKIMAQILQLQQLPAGSTLDIQEAEEIQGIRDDGRIIPASVSRKKFQPRSLNISPELAKTAGIDRNVLASKESALNKAASAAYTAEQNAAIDANIVEAYQAGDEERVAALRLLRDPMKATKPEKPDKPTFTPFSGELAEPGEGVQQYPDGRIVIWRRHPDGRMVSETIDPPSDKSEDAVPVTKNGERVEASQKEKINLSRQREIPTQAEKLAEKKFTEKKANLRAKVSESWPQLVAKRSKLKKDTTSLLKTISKAKKLITESTVATGVSAFLLKDLPNTDARDLRNLLRKLKAYAGFSTLEGMRDAAPSGASGLGALSQQEMELLIAQKFTGDQETDGESLLRAINDLEEDAIRTLEIGEEMHNNIASTFNLTVDRKPAAPTERVLQTPVDDLINKYKNR
jgi:hypothetical protein